MSARSETLTARQQEILDFFRATVESEGRPPTRAEVCTAFGFRSPNAAETHLGALAAKGAILLEEGRARGIRLAEALGLPLVGRVAAGSPILAAEHVEARYQLDPALFSPKADYLLRVRGMSMRDAGILDGDLIAPMSIPARICERPSSLRGWYVSASNRSSCRYQGIGCVLSFLLLCLLSACSSSPVAKPNKLELAKMPPPKPTGSLWQEENGRAYLYEDLRAMRAGDIITILISEKHKGSKSADTSAEKDSAISNGFGGTGMGYLGLPGIRLGGEANRGFGIHDSAKNKFGGKGATNREDTLTSTISAIVTEVLPNGDLRIEGGAKSRSIRSGKS